MANTNNKSIIKPIITNYKQKPSLYHNNKIAYNNNKNQISIRNNN